MTSHVFPVQVYYEDTDHSGSVYHANYLKFFERAREHALGVDEVVRLLREDGIGFVVYRAELTYREAAVFGDALEIHTTVTLESDYRLMFKQDARRAERLLVAGVIQLACIDRSKELAPIPPSVARRFSPSHK